MVPRQWCLHTADREDVTAPEPDTPKSWPLTLARPHQVLASVCQRLSFCVACHLLAATLGFGLPTWAPRWRLAKWTSGMKRTGWVSRSMKGLKTVMSMRLWDGRSGTLTSETEKKKKNTRTPQSAASIPRLQAGYRASSLFKKLKL